MQSPTTLPPSPNPKERKGTPQNQLATMSNILKASNDYADDQNILTLRQTSIATNDNESLFVSRKQQI